MSRGASAAVQAEQAKPRTRVGHLYELYFDAATVYMTDFPHPVPWGANTYLAAGDLLGFDSVRETLELLVSVAKIKLSGINQLYIQKFLTVDYIDRRVVIYEAYLNQTTGAVLVDPVVKFDGLMGRPVIDEDPDSGKCEITVECSNHLVDFDKRCGRHTNDAEQQLWFPGDTGFRHVNQAARPVNWGRAD